MTTPAGSRRFCILCGHPADSREHYIPVWLSAASERSHDPLEKGLLTAGQITEREDRGTARTAHHRNLCDGCNQGLGTHLEGEIKDILKSLIARTPPHDWASYLSYLLPRQRRMLSWWAALRALQLGELMQNRKLEGEIRDALVVGLRKVSYGQRPHTPKGLRVELARSTVPSWGFTISRQFFDRSRGGATVNRPESFIWAMHVNHLLLVAAFAPGAHLLKDLGWGYSMVGGTSRSCPHYRDLADMMGRSHIDTRFPKSS